MTKIFISYRHDDSEFVVDSICQRLKTRFGPESVFVDVDNIPPGVDYRKHLHHAVRQCDILLAVIGKYWLDASKDGNRRLDDPADFVRIEIQAALERDIPVVPILLGGVSMPRNDQLPVELADLTYRHAIQVRRSNFGDDLDKLVRGLNSVLEKVAGQTTDGAANMSADKNKDSELKEIESSGSEESVPQESESLWGLDGSEKNADAPTPTGSETVAYEPDSLWGESGLPAPAQSDKSGGETIEQLSDTLWGNTSNVDETRTSILNREDDSSSASNLLWASSNGEAKHPTISDSAEQTDKPLWDGHGESSPTPRPKPR